MKKEFVLFSGSFVPLLLGDDFIFVVVYVLNLVLFKYKI